MRVSCGSDDNGGCGGGTEKGSGAAGVVVVVGGTGGVVAAGGAGGGTEKGGAGGGIGVPGGLLNWTYCSWACAGWKFAARLTFRIKITVIRTATIAAPLIP
jgi:hypothetical protein